MQRVIPWVLIVAVLVVGVLTARPAESRQSVAASPDSLADARQRFVAAVRASIAGR